MLYGYENYCQAEVQSKSSPTPNSKSKLLTPNSNSRLDWRDTIIEQTTHHISSCANTIFPLVPPHPPAISKALLKVLLPSVIPFRKPLMTQNLNPNSGAKFCKFFRNPTIQTPQMLYLFEILTLPFTLNPPHFPL